MSRRTRTIIGISLIEILLASLWFWLSLHAARNPDRVSPDAQQVIGQTMGSVMGVIAGLAIPLYLFARKNDLSSGS